MQTSPLPQTLRAAIGLALTPPLVVSLTGMGAAAAHHGAPPVGAAAETARAALMAGYFVGVAVFLPVYLFLRRYADMACPARLTMLGACSGWTAPVAYMLLMTVWRGDFFNSFVLDTSPLLLTPSNVAPGALGGFLFWLIAAAPIRSRASASITAAFLRPASQIRL